MQTRNALQRNRAHPPIVLGHIMIFTNIPHAGKTYSLACDEGQHGESRGHLRIVCHETGETITDISGCCNPFIGFWRGRALLLTGAARTAAMLKIARETVAHEVALYDAYKAK